MEVKKPLPAVVGNRNVLFLKHLNPNLKHQQKLNRISFQDCWPCYFMILYSSGYYEGWGV
jgi:hypothetical protein